MGKTNNLDKIHHKKEQEKKRQKAKSGRPTSGEWVDPVAIAQSKSSSGKGSKNRLGNWSIDPDITQKMEKIFGKSWKKGIEKDTRKKT